VKRPDHAWFVEAIGKGGTYLLEPHRTRKDARHRLKYLNKHVHLAIYRIVKFVRVKS